MRPLVILLLLTVPAAGQERTGTIAGTVRYLDAVPPAQRIVTM